MDFFRCVSELSNGARQNLLGLIELLELAVDVDEVEEDARAFLHAELLAEVCAVLVTARAFHFCRLHLTGWVLNGWQSEDVLKRFLRFLPVLLLDFDLRFHQHKDWVVSDAEILRKRLLEEVVRGAHVASVGVDDGGEDVRLDYGLVLGQAVVDLA